MSRFPEFEFSILSSAVMTLGAALFGASFAVYLITLNPEEFKIFLTNGYLGMTVGGIIFFIGIIWPIMTYRRRNR